MSQKNLIIVVSLAIIAIVIAFVFFISPCFNNSVQPIPSYIVFTDGVNYYAKNGTTQAVVYSGTDARMVINDALSHPNTSVYIAPGTYSIRTWLCPSTNDTLYGAGISTVLDFGNSKTGIAISSPNCSIGDLEFINNGTIGVFTDYVTVHDITAIGSWNYPGEFYVYPNNDTLSNIDFINCTSINASTCGFILTGEGNPCLVQNINFINCQAINSGRYARDSDWVVGFDFAEYAYLTVQNLLAQNSTASGSWESGFHFEPAPPKLMSN